LMARFGMFGKKNQEPVADRPPAEDGGPGRRGGNLFGRLRSGLQKTHDKVTGGLRSVLGIGRKLDEETIEKIEEQLYLADIGPRMVMRMCEQLREACRKGEIVNSDQVLPFLKERIKEELRVWDTSLHLPRESIGVILVAGVNGSGKTTTIGKLAHSFRKQGKKVLLAASDTFRAGAVEQLRIWAEWAGADIVKNESADPAAVCFDACEKALAGHYDILIIDTAGRVHTRRNLMSELQKICRVTTKRVPGAPHETLMVLDATTGQNALSQALRFNEAINITGLVLAKLDGTAKGGMVFGMRDQIDIPVKFVGMGQNADDLAPFDPDRFVDALFE